MTTSQENKQKLYRGARQYFPVRIIIFTVSGTFTTFVAYGRTELGWAHYLFLIIYFLWPYLALFHAKLSRNSRDAEQFNLLMDVGFSGTTVPLSLFHPWVLISITTLGLMGPMANGGIRLFLKGLTSYCIGIVIAIPFFGFNVNYSSTTVETIIGSLLLFFGVQIYGYLNHHGVKRLRHIKTELNKEREQLFNANEEIDKKNKELEKANKAKSNFLANMSHEIRTPLHGIIGFSELMLTTDSIETCHKHAETIFFQSEHLLGIINDILDQEKIDAGKINVEEIPMNIDVLFNSIVSITNLMADEKGLELKTFISENVHPYVIGDPLRLRQIILNLTSNAIKFTKKGSVIIKVELIDSHTVSDHQTLKFSVQDTGIGIPLDRQQSIFDEFSQADESTTRKYGGTGLGTSIAKKLVELMGGKISIESEEGKGSCFSFIIGVPICQEEVFKKNVWLDTVITPDDERLTGNILVAEDHPVNQKLARIYLESAGHTVTIAENGEIAVDKCARETFDLIFMDVQMPVMDGFEATRLIRKENPICPDIPIIGLTANVDEASRLRCKEAGMDDIKGKPAKKKNLLLTVQKWLATKNQGADPE